jgi:hypothetical protein
MGMQWETGQHEKKKKNPSRPPNLKSKAPWAFQLAEMKTNPPPPPNKTWMESPVSRWTLDSPLSTPNTA